MRGPKLRFESDMMVVRELGGFGCCTKIVLSKLMLLGENHWECRFNGLHAVLELWLDVLELTKSRPRRLRLRLKLTMFLHLVLPILPILLQQGFP